MIFPTSIATIQSTLRSTGPSGGGGVPSPSKSRLRFYGATSEFGGSNYQMGQLIHNINTDGPILPSGGRSTIVVNKTNTLNDVDISNFQTTGIVSTELSEAFVIRAIGTRNGVNSAIQGANTDDSVGVVGQGNPNKIDRYEGNETEGIKFEVVNLNSAYTISISTIYVTRANFVGTSKPQMVLTPFDPLGLTGGYTINSSGTNIVPINVSSPEMNLVGTGSGVNGDFTIGIGATEGFNVGYGLYAIDFDITNTP